MLMGESTLSAGKTPISAFSTLRVPFPSSGLVLGHRSEARASTSSVSAVWSRFASWLRALIAISEYFL